jgi:plastocyanin
MAEPDTEQPAAAPSPAAAARALIPLSVALVVGAGIYILASSITPDPTSGLFGTSGTGTFPLKSWLSSGVLALAALQLYTSLWIYGKVNRRRGVPRRLGLVHRISGVAAIVLSIPIAYNCLRTYGFESFNARVGIHAVAGCFFYGAFAAKIVIVRSKRLPGWTLPVAGGTLVTVVALLWYTAALWYFDNFKVPLLDAGVSASKSSAPAYGPGGYGAAPNPAASPRAGAGGGELQVAYRGIAISPDPITVHVGQKIRWTNFDSTLHNVIVMGNSSEKFTSPDLKKGATFVFAPTRPGAIHYLCTYHPGSMTGTITVVK